MKIASYQNYKHYIKDGWLKEPKKFFLQLLSYLEKNKSNNKLALLDIGCATGELIYFLQAKFPLARLIGIDVFDDLLHEARKMLPRVEFNNCSVLSLPDSMSDKFDIVTAMGVMSIFNPDELSVFWNNLLKITKPGGSIYVFSPLNEYGVDALISHRKNKEMVGAEWEAGWNIYAFETIRAILDSYACQYEFDRFSIAGSLARKSDPIRTWTIKTEHNDYQLINGLKLMVDHYFIKVKKTDEEVI